MEHLQYLGRKDHQETISSALWIHFLDPSQSQIPICQPPDLPPQKIYLQFHHPQTLPQTRLITQRSRPRLGQIWGHGHFCLVVWYETESLSGFGWGQIWVCWVLELEQTSQVREDSCAQSSPCHDHQGDEHWTQESRHWVVKSPHIPPPATCLPTCSSLATQSVAAAPDLQAAEKHLAPSCCTTSGWPLLFPSAGLAPLDVHASTAPGALQCNH